MSTKNKTLEELMLDPNLPSKKEDRIEFLVDNGIKYAIAKQACSKGTHKVDQMSVLVKIFREEPGRKEAVARALAETEYTESTINHFYNAVTFAKEWSRQEATK
jgi:CO/xanthine dehydrogenase FAD-binding subunit